MNELIVGAIGALLIYKAESNAQLTIGGALLGSAVAASLRKEA